MHVYVWKDGYMYVWMDEWMDGWILYPAAPILTMDGSSKEYNIIILKI